jgi:N-acyl homoserine lactone hydrolase
MANKIGKLLCSIVAVAAIAMAQPKAPDSLRLYLFECGRINATSAENYSLKKEEVALLPISVPCYLVVHPKGTLMWDTGIIPDSQFKPGRGEVSTGISSSPMPLLPQLAAAGYKPSDITYLALSHYHGDHVANANAFAGSTWLVNKLERDFMFTDPPPAPASAPYYAALKNSKTILVNGEYDVFGDGSVVLKSTPGHTPGHQVLFLKLAKTGPLLLTGDLYHYPEERTLNRLPVREFNRDQTAASRADVEAFLKKTGAQMWIGHDLATYSKLRKSPAYYD